MVGWQRAFETSTDRAGQPVIRGIPFFPGDPIWVHVAANVAGQTLSAVNRARVRGDGTLHAAAMLVMPAAWQAHLDLTVPLDDGHTFADDDLPTEESLGIGGIDGEGDIRLRVLRRDGTPARGAAVRIAGRDTTTGDDGIASVRRIAADEIIVSIVDNGLTPTTEVLLLRPHDVLDVTLREPEPASLDVEVTFEDGRAAPFARLEFLTPSGVPPYDLVEGVLRLDPCTNADGRRTFTRVEPAEIRVTATWGSRSSSASVRLLAGRRGAARVVLPEPSMVPPPGFRDTEITEER
jgi:hypothetical protein